MGNEAIANKLFIDANELMARKEPLLVVIEDGWIGFSDYDYRVKLSRIKTHQKLLALIAHLLEKDWVTSEMLLQFIEQAARYNKLNITDNGR